MQTKFVVIYTSYYSPCQWADIHLLNSPVKCFLVDYTLRGIKNSHHVPRHLGTKDYTSTHMPFRQWASRTPLNKDIGIDRSRLVFSQDRETGHQSSETNKSSKRCLVDEG